MTDDTELAAWQRLQKSHGNYYGQQSTGPSFGIDTTGYEVWYLNQEPDGCSDVRVHRLLVISQGADPHKVFSGGDYHVHHKNGVKWDNRPSNVELLQSGEHTRIHTMERIENGTQVSIDKIHNQDQP